MFSFSFNKITQTGGEKSVQLFGHLPRLDWRVWFLPLSARRAGPARESSARRIAGRGPPGWFFALLDGLVEGNEDIRSLLREDCPFKDKPPKFVRCRLMAFVFEREFGWRATDLGADDPMYYEISRKPKTHG